VLMCPACLAARARGRGPFPDLTDDEMRAGLDLLPTWALEQKAAANRQVIAVMGQRLAVGEQVARMYQEPGVAWLERQAEVAEDLVARRKLAEEPTRVVPGWVGEWKLRNRQLRARRNQTATHKGGRGTERPQE
ncbi:MAG: hypothetical protein M3328_15360, partial [Chloroflexota bacterium]|nr:hypothetical protein [Chloroflexota bacterium]